MNKDYDPRHFIHVIPMLRVSVLLLLGIICGDYLIETVNIRLWLIIYAVVLALAIVTMKRSPWVSSVSFLVCIFCIGAIRISFYDTNLPGEEGLSGSIQQWALDVRQGIVDQLASASGDSDALGVASAMALGDKNMLSAELRETYSRAGASHILALSGMHLAIVYFILASIFRTNKRRASITILLFIWAYVVLTGMSVSVVRAAIMLTLWQILNSIGREQHPLNVLGLTASIIMLVTPDCVWNIGFQMSFMAVLFILILLPYWQSRMPQRLCRPSASISHQFSKTDLAVRRMGRWLWSACGVSIAAQMAVAPLSLHYFGRLSNYFLVTNLIVIPCATVVVSMMLLFVLLTMVGTIIPTAIVSDAIGKAVCLTTRMMNQVLERLSALPGASIEDMYINKKQVVLLYIIIATLLVIFHKYFFTMPTSVLYRPEQD